MFWLLIKLTAAGRLFVESSALHKKLSAIFAPPPPGGREKSFPDKMKDMADTIMNSAFVSECDSCATRRCRGLEGGQMNICKANAKKNACALQCCGFLTFNGGECLDLSTLRPKTVGLSGGGMAANVLDSLKSKRAVKYVIPNHGPEAYQVPGSKCGVNSKVWLTHHMNTAERTYESNRKVRLARSPDVLILGVGPMPKPGPANPDQNLRNGPSVAHIAKIHNPYGSAEEGGDLYGPNEGDMCYSMSIDKMASSSVIFVIGQSTGNDGGQDKGQLELAKIGAYARDQYPLYVLLAKALADPQGPDVVWIGHYSVEPAFLEEAEVTADRSLEEVEVTADGSVKHVSARRLVVREDDSARNEGS